MSGDKFFVDTNVLIYFFDGRQPEKRMMAQQWITFLWSSGAGRLSLQVLHEFLRKRGPKKRRPSSHRTGSCGGFFPVGTDRHNPRPNRKSLVLDGWRATHLLGALILASAERAQCRWLLSEDFQTGRQYKTVTVINPFERVPSEFAGVTH